MYIKRQVEDTIKKVSEMYPAVIVTDQGRLENDSSKTALWRYKIVTSTTRKLWSMQE